MDFTICDEATDRENVNSGLFWCFFAGGRNIIKQQHFLISQWPNIWLGLWDGPMCINLLRRDLYLFLFLFATNVLISFWVLNALH